MITLELHRVKGIEFACAGGFLENFVDGRFEVGIERFEQVFK